MPKILIVDDNQGLRMLFAKRLQRAGFEVNFAFNGHNGLQEAQKLRPDLIILDYQMPVMDGDEMLRRMRRTEWGRDIKVIMVTASSSLQDIEGIEEVSLIIYKPVSTIELMDAVNKILLPASEEKPPKE